MKPKSLMPIHRSTEKILLLCHVLRMRTATPWVRCKMFVWNILQLVTGFILLWIRCVFKDRQHRKREEKRQRKRKNGIKWLNVAEKHGRQPKLAEPKFLFMTIYSAYFRFSCAYYFPFGFCFLKYFLISVCLFVFRIGQQKRAMKTTIPALTHTHFAILLFNERFIVVIFLHIAHRNSLKKFMLIFLNLIFVSRSMQFDGYFSSSA